MISPAIPNGSRVSGPNWPSFPIGWERIDFVLLKGFSLGPEYTLDRRLRMLYDFDLFVPEESTESAFRAVLSLGYEPFPSNLHLPKDHLPTLTRKTGWQWQCNPFDPEIPPAVELHFRFWNSEAERLPAPGVEEFWHRRVDEDRLPVLHPVESAGSIASATPFTWPRAPLITHARCR